MVGAKIKNQPKGDWWNNKTKNWFCPLVMMLDQIWLVIGMMTGMNLLISLRLKNTRQSLNRKNRKSKFLFLWDVCSRTVLEDELSHLLDYLLDFACDEKILVVYKKVCRKYLYVYPRYIKFYIEAYREMWEDESKEVKDFK